MDTHADTERRALTCTHMLLSITEHMRMTVGRDYFFSKEDSIDSWSGYLAVLSSTSTLAKVMCAL